MAMEHSPVVCLQLIDDASKTLDHHCSLCLFFHDVSETCPHTQPRARAGPSSTVYSDQSYYTAETSSGDSSMSATRVTKSIRATVWPSKSPQEAPRLRRTSSPTERSLRELRDDQAKRDDLRTKRSEEQLQRVYESQILTYLNGHYAELERIEEE